MRDPERIDRIINKLRTLWHSSPDLRLGQLVANLAPCSNIQSEDSGFEIELDRVLAGGWGAKRPRCENYSPPWFSGSWNDWHRGHGCDRDDGKPRSAEAQAEIDGHEATP